MGSNAARAEDAEAFLKKRQSCGGNGTCLREAYVARIEALKRGIGDWFRSEQAVSEAPQWSAGNLPGPVAAIADGYAKSCSQIGGTLAAGFDTPSVMTADLDQDGVQDFVLNPQNMQCSAAATAYCGNGGCQIALALSRDNFADPVTIMGGAPSLAQGEEGSSLEVWVANSNCTTTEAASSCLGRYSWRDGKLATSFEAREFQQ
ncbi:hypothetical protein [Chelativorans sp.]|uniref:hypothetical protein n=1 Tax=Chelativorans sp. TaxID=2203393 RepID=UPI00281168A7|nr:hypothetical protein [Chelativorans sp.]